MEKANESFETNEKNIKNIKYMEEKKLELELDKNYPCILQKVEKVFQELYDHYRVLVSRTEYLDEENKRLKSEAYKDEELSKMKVEYEKMKADYYRGFAISEEEDGNIREWEDKMLGDEPLTLKINSARFHYEFYPTPLGTVGAVIDSLSGEKLVFRDLC